MGQVYRARDTRLERTVAIKILPEHLSSNPDLRARFEREAKAISSLSHPHICPLYDVGHQDGIDFLVMEYLEGQTLADRLKKGPLPLEQVLRYAIQVTSALDTAHRHGVIHRDLKPGNIMLVKSGAKLLDFGLAKVRAPEAVAGMTELPTQTTPLTSEGTILGTLQYMAPEQLEGGEADARTDIFAFGVVIYEMATGRKPFAGKSQANLISAIMTAEPQPVSILQPLASPALDRLIIKCLAKDPEDRWQSAQDVKFELEWAAESEQASQAAERQTRTSRFWPVIAVLAALGLATFGFFYFRGPASEPPVMYATILPPERTSFDFTKNLGTVSLSPDGRSMVFAATGEDSKSQLWLRRLEAAVAQPLEGTRNGTFPFWSPDSRSVGFFADGMLKKIDSKGGPPIALTEAGGMGGSWSPKGMIVFATTTFAPLLKISSDGGSATPAVGADAAMGTAHGFPWFLPDGEHFLFVSWGGAGHMNLRVGSLTSKATTLIGETDSKAVYANGRLLYLRGNTLVARPFDLKTLRTSGEPTPVAEHVARFLALIQDGAFSASATGLLAYQNGADADLRQLTWFDRAGQPMGTIGEPRRFFDIEFSPDQRNLMASAPDAAGNYDLWMYDTKRGLPTRLTFDPGGEYFGIWSADGRSIIFNSTRKGHYDLYRKSANGAGPEELVYADETDKVPTGWSHDGKSLLYFTGGGEHYKLYLLPLTLERPGTPLKSAPLLNTGFDEYSAKFSPDDRWIAYETNQSGQNEVYVAPSSRPAEKHQVSSRGGTGPRWSPDGKKIFYAALDGRLTEAEVHLSGETAEVGAVRPVFVKMTKPVDGPWDVSADGQRVLAAVPVEKSAEPVTLVQNWIGMLKK